MTHRKPTSTARPSPLSVRVSTEERAMLVRAAASRPLSTYVRERLFGDSTDANKKQIAKCLADLGASGIAKSLSDLSATAQSGKLTLDDDTRNALKSALQDIRDLRAALLKGLGLRGKDRR